MVDGDLFDKISKVGSIIRKHNDPFGGIQVGQLFIGTDNDANCTNSSLSRGTFSSYRQ